jgi:hypothetical protein
MQSPRVLVVGTYASVNAWATDQGMKADEDYYVVTSKNDLLKAVNSEIETVYITYGWNEMPTSRALEIADFLVGAGIDRKSWRYVV